MSDDVIHISPINDLVEHKLEGEDCVCGPDVEPVMRSDGSNGWIVRHHQLDGRAWFRPTGREQSRLRLGGPPNTRGSA